MSEENEFNMYKNIVNNYFRTETFEKAKEFCARDMVQLNQRYITEAVCRNEALNRADKLEKENANKDKVIDLMAEHLFNVGKLAYRTNIFTKEELIQKYYEEVGDIE